MGCETIVKEQTKKKLNFKKLASKIEEYINILKITFNNGENGAKIISTPIAEATLRTALGDKSYNYVLELLESIQDLMYGNTPEWKRRITDYVNGWTFIQNQVLLNLRKSGDLLTKISSAAIVGQGILTNIERNSLQREVDIYADEIIEISTSSNGANGMPLMWSPKLYGNGIGSNPIEGSQPFLGPDGKKINIKGSVQYKVNNGPDDPRFSGVDRCEQDLLNFFVDIPKGKLTNSYDLGLKDTSASFSGNARVKWADVRNEYFSTLTLCICNGDINASINDAICRVYSANNSNNFPIRNINSSGTESGFNIDFFNNSKLLSASNTFACTLTSGKNLSSCINELISAQNNNINYNESALELAIEQGKMAFEKASELQSEVENIFESVEVSLNERADLAALLAVSGSTSMIC